MSTPFKTSGDLCTTDTTVISLLDYVPIRSPDFMYSKKPWALILWMPPICCFRVSWSTENVCLQMSLPRSTFKYSLFLCTSTFYSFFRWNGGGPSQSTFVVKAIECIFVSCFGDIHTGTKGLIISNVRVGSLFSLSLSITWQNKIGVACSERHLCLIDYREDHVPHSRSFLSPRGRLLH